MNLVSNSMDLVSDSMGGLCHDDDLEFLTDMLNPLRNATHLKLITQRLPDSWKLISHADSLD